MNLLLSAVEEEKKKLQNHRTQRVNEKRTNALPAKRYNFSDESPQSGEDDAITIANEAWNRLNHDDDASFRMIY